MLACPVLVCLGLAGCGAEPPKNPADLVVAVSIPPQKYIVQRIAGDQAEVIVLVGPGASPATYEPKPSQLRSMSRAVAYFCIGVPFEAAWLKKITATHPNLQIIDTCRGIERMTMNHDHGHSAGDEGDGLDPHTWLSPELVGRQAREICAALCALRPDEADRFRNNLAAFETDIEQLGAELRELLQSCAGRAFVAVHPSWGYFAREYGLRMLPMHIGGLEPSPVEFSEMLKSARAASVQTIFAQPEFNMRPAELLASELGAAVHVISPLGENWPDTLRSAARALAGAGTQDAGRSP